MTQTWGRPGVGPGPAGELTATPAYRGRPTTVARSRTARHGRADRFVQLTYFDWLEIVTQDRSLPHELARFLGVIVRFQNGLSGRDVRIPPALWAVRIGVSERTVGRWIKQLLDAGYLVQVATAAPGRTAVFDLYGPGTSDTAERDPVRRTSDTDGRDGVRRSELKSSDTAERERVRRVRRTSDTSERADVRPKHHESTSSSSVGLSGNDRAHEQTSDDDGGRRPDDDLGTIASQIHEARTAGKPWGLPGIKSNLAKARRAGWTDEQLLAAGKDAAADPSKNTPTWELWPQPVESRRDPPKCAHCHLPDLANSGHRIAGQINDPHTFIPEGDPS